MAIELDVVTRLNERSARAAANAAERQWEQASRNAGNAVERNLTAGNDRAVRNVERMSTQLERHYNRAANASGRVRLEQERYNALIRSGETDRVKLIQQSERLAAARRAEQSATRQAASAHRDYDRSIRDLGDAGASARNRLLGLGSVIGALGRVGTPVAAAVLAKGLLDIIPVAITATQSIALLPGVLSAAGAGFGALTLATSGFGDAIEDIRDPEAFAEALQSLSPAAQQAALSIQNLLPGFDELKSATQDALFSGMGEQIHQLSTQYLPQVQQLTTGIAGAFNTMATSVANELMTPESQAQIQSLFSNITASFRELVPAAGSLTQAFLNIANAGSSFLPGLAQAASQAAQQFAAFIDEASRSGDLNRWIQEGIEAVRLLGQAIGMVGGVLYDVFGGSGQQSINNFNDSLTTTTELLGLLTLDTQTWGESWRQELDSMHGPLGSFRDTLMDIPEAMAWIGNKAIDMANTVKSGLDWMSENFTNFMNNILPGEDRTFTPLPDIPHLPSGGDWGGHDYSGFEGPGRTPGSYRMRNGEEARIPARGLPSSTPYPGPYSVPAAPASASSSTSRTSYGYTSDQALLSNVPAGTYSQTGAADLVQGLGDCSSAIEDLVNMIDGRSTAGRSMSTHNAHEWLTSRGFVPGYMPGAFNVGFNEGHMQATLPGGTPFNWGSQSAAARRGIGGTGALDPSFTAQYYRPVDTGPMGTQSGVQQVAVDSFGSSAQADLNGIGGQLGNQLDQDFGISKGLPGLAENAVKFVGNLFFAPLLTALNALAGGRDEGSGLIGMMASAGGYGAAPGMGAPVGSAPLFGVPAAAGVSALGPAALQPPATMPPSATGAPLGTPASGVGLGAPPGAAPGPGTPGALGLPFGGGGSMLPGAGMPQSAPMTSGGMAYPASGGGGFQGMGGLPMDAAMMATTGLDALMPGAGALAKVGVQLANRTVAYLGQVAGIGVSGLFETLSLGDNPMGSFGKTWAGRLAGGFAGARPALPNIAGQAAPAMSSAKDPRAGAQQGLAAAKGGDTNITVNNNRPTEDGTGRDIAWHMRSPPGRQG